MSAGTLQNLVVCSAAGSTNSPLCPPGEKLQLIQGYVLDAASQSFFDTLFTSSGQLDLLLQGGFDGGAFQIAFVGILLIFASGLAVGVVVNIIRKSGGR